MRRISPTEPVGADAVVQPQSVQPELEGAHVKRTVRTVVVLAGGWLCKQRGAAVAAGFGQHGFRQFEHEVGTGL